MLNKPQYRSIFCPDFQHARTLLIPAILSLLLFARPSHGIECYSNENKKSLLRTKNGENDLGTCKSSTSECYETFKSDSMSGKEDGYATYTAGCTPCENRDTTTMLCYKCKEALCNTFFASDIREKNHQCFSDGNQNTFGSRTVYCFTGITECYYEEVTTSTKKIHYLAGCGRPKAKCSSEFCKVCTKKLCNYPENMRAIVTERNKKSDKKPVKDKEKAGKAAKKKPCKDGEDGEGGEGGDCKEGAAEKSDDANKKNVIEGEGGSDLDSDSSVTQPACSTAFLILVTSLSAVLVFVGKCPGC